MSTEQEHDLVHVANNESMALILNILADYTSVLTEAKERLLAVERHVESVEEAYVGVVGRKIEDLEEAIGRLEGKLQALEVKHNTEVAGLEHRIVVLESQMEQARAQIEGLTLGMVTFSLDDPSREKLAALLRGKRQGESDDPILPEEEGTSRR